MADTLLTVALQALKRLTDGMDRAGGDGYGMPECPWCRCQFEDNAHAPECELVLARIVIADLERLAGVAPRKDGQ